MKKGEVYEGIKEQIKLPKKSKEEVDGKTDIVQKRLKGQQRRIRFK